MSEHKMCPCGKPLHYTNPHIRVFIEAQIEMLGEKVPITIIQTGRKFLVPRHYIALHKVKGWELPELVGKFGIEEV